MQDLRVRNKDLVRDLGRKEEQHDRARLQLEEAKEQMREDANERRQVRALARLEGWGGVCARVRVRVYVCVCVRASERRLVTIACALPARSWRRRCA